MKYGCTPLINVLCAEEYAEPNGDLMKNTIEAIEIGGQKMHLVVIRELFCYRHPTSGHIIKKSYNDPPGICRFGPPPRTSVDAQLIIDREKRRIEQYNTTSGDLNITEWWWEPPGDPPGRYNRDGSPERLEEYRAAGGSNW